MKSSYAASPSAHMSDTGELSVLLASFLAIAVTSSGAAVAMSYSSTDVLPARDHQTKSVSFTLPGVLAFGAAPHCAFARLMFP